jgi:chromosome segregation ATPase
MILVLEDKVRASEDCQAEVDTLSTQKAALRKEVDKLREQRQADLRTFTLEVDEQKKLAEQLRQELASTQDAYRELTVQEAARTEERDALQRQGAGLRATVLLLEGKVKVHESLEREVAHTALEDRDHLSARKQLQADFKSMVDRFDAELRDLRNHLSGAEDEKSELLARHQELQVLYDDLVAKGEANKIDAVEPALLKAEFTQRQAACQARDEAKKDAEVANLRRAELENELVQTRAKLQETVASERRRYDVLAEELLVAKQRHAEVLTHQTDRQTAVAELSAEKSRALNEVAVLKAKLLALEARSSTASRLNAAVVTAEAARSRVQEDLGVAISAAEEKATEERSVAKEARESTRAVQAELAKVQEELRASKDENSQLQIKQSELASIVVTLDAQVTRLTDVEQQLQAQLEIVAQHEAERERQRTDVAEMTEKFTAAMEKWKKEKHEIISSTSEKDREMRKLLMRIQELGIGYVPVKNDPVDQALAEMIAAYAPPVPFFRQQPGVYLFGTRQCVAALQADALVFRIGGGFLQYEAFVDTYGPEEREKLLASMG